MTLTRIEILGFTEIDIVIGNNVEENYFSYCLEDGIVYFRHTSDYGFSMNWK